ncbi:MAG: hypothetical protein UZ13_00910 [Chloroflexi bacterium OLB13]|nr:MAG: hypothetical protein UZ13_00910 [Chloroflexi bacterium OLB13]
MNAYEVTNYLESRMQGQPARPVRGALGGNRERKLCGAAIRLHKDNPKAANQVVVGLLFIVFASSVTALITFA